MNLREKLRSKGFWLSIGCVILMLIQLFGVKIDVPVANEVINVGLSVLAVLGIISSPVHNEEQGEDTGSINIAEENIDSDNQPKNDKDEAHTNSHW